jgi:uncharacterized membrane protein
MTASAAVLGGVAFLVTLIGFVAAAWPFAPNRRRKR